MRFRPTSKVHGFRTQKTRIWINVGLVLRIFVLGLFCFNAHYQFAPLLNLSPLIFGLTLFHWLLSITLTPLSDGNITFDLLHFDIRPVFRNTSMAKNKALSHSLPCRSPSKYRPFNGVATHFKLYSAIIKNMIDKSTFRRCLDMTENFFIKICYDPWRCLWRTEETRWMKWVNNKAFQLQHICL